MNEIKAFWLDAWSYKVSLLPVLVTYLLFDAQAIYRRVRRLIRAQGLMDVGFGTLGQRKTDGVALPRSAMRRRLSRLAAPQRCSLAWA